MWSTFLVTFVVFSSFPAFPGGLYAVGSKKCLMIGTVKAQLMLNAVFPKQNVVKATQLTTHPSIWVQYRNSLRKASENGRNQLFKTLVRLFL